MSVADEDTPNVLLASSLVNTVETLVDFCDISINTASCACKFVLGVLQTNPSCVFKI